MEDFAEDFVKSCCATPCPHWSLCPTWENTNRQLPHLCSQFDHRSPRRHPLSLLSLQNPAGTLLAIGSCRFNKDSRWVNKDPNSRPKPNRNVRQSSNPFVGCSLANLIGDQLCASPRGSSGPEPVRANLGSWRFVCSFKYHHHSSSSPLHSSHFTFTSSHVVTDSRTAPTRKMPSMLVRDTLQPATKGDGVRALRRSSPWSMSSSLCIGKIEDTAFCGEIGGYLSIFNLKSISKDASSATQRTQRTCAAIAGSLCS